MMQAADFTSLAAMQLPDLKTVGERLKWARKRKNLTQTELGSAVGLSYQAIEQTENNRTKKPTFLAEAAQILEVPYGWLKNGDLEYYQSSTRNQGFAEGVPVYGYASGAGTKVAINEGAIVERIPERVPGMGNDGFYLIVNGDSMEPVFEQGDKIAVSRAIPPRKGRYCVIEFVDGCAMVKKFISRTEKELVCEQLNPKKTIKYNMNEVINIYAVVGHIF